MRRMMMAVVLAVAGIAAAASDVDALKDVLEKVTDAEEQFRLANNYAEGKGVAKDEIATFKLYLKAAEQGHADAQNRLAICYWDGKGVASNATLTVFWFRKAAEQEHAGAQHSLGECYEKLKG